MNAAQVFADNRVSGAPAIGKRNREALKLNQYQLINAIPHYALIGARLLYAAVDET
ncbi:hypothetical protein AWB67_07112 [Caballeronia terrestris]|jgi:hypothetical protein|uniref:Uncharacterized protein n=2 Tax=Caballeronia TaxID=1827195 RepID=A0A158KRR8_9BURK|nr:MULTISPECIES: hypothetical protein [Caballeronia]SAL83828.1 hypothetical protein AWB68_07060 [Caballeronia choica]SAL86099.1 hypothetical protein AWB67_07112 [Caballeronia terrestris]